MKSLILAIISASMFFAFKAKNMLAESASYFTTSNTDVIILYNVMNYPSTVINGQSYRSSGANMPQRLTKGQVQFLLKEIDLQKKGAGILVRDPYWFYPGIPVK